jgi:pyruvate formate lyase activating enzyme
VFLKGCYLRCAWCHNPESTTTRPEILFDAGSCIACLACYAACEIGALTLIDRQGNAIPPEALPRVREDVDQIGDRVHDSARCVRCGACVEACYAGALEMAGREMSVDEAMRDVLADRPFYDRAGGITISGGEPLFQHRFTEALLARCRAEGLHTALDTTAFGHWEPLAQLLPHVDLVLLDLKAMDPEVHKTWTGVDNATILRNARALGAWMAQHAPGGQEGHGVWVRVPVVPGVNDDEANLRATAGFVRDEMSGAVRAVELLGYHTLGGDKLERLGRDNPMAGVAPLTRDEVARRAAWVLQELEGTGIAVRWR